MFSVGECTLLSYHKIRKTDEIEKDFCIVIFLHILVHGLNLPSLS